MGFLDTLRSGLNSWDNARRGFLGSLAPLAGGALGSYFGGAGGGALGSTAGSWLGNLIRGDNGEGHMSPGTATTGFLNSLIPNGAQNTSFGQMGQGIMDYAGNALNGAIGRYMPQLGGLGLGSGALNAGANWLRDKFSSSYPSAYSAANNYASMTPGQASTGIGSYLNRSLPNYGAGMAGGFNAPGGNFSQAPGRFSVNPGMQSGGYGQMSAPQQGIQNGSRFSVNPGMMQHTYASGGYVDPMDYNDYEGSY